MILALASAECQSQLGIGGEQLGQTAKLLRYGTAAQEVGAVPDSFEIECVFDIFAFPQYQLSQSE